MKPKNQTISKNTGVDCVAACHLWESKMLVAEHTRWDYGEQRRVALGKVKGRTMVVAYTKKTPGVDCPDCFIP